MLTLEKPHKYDMTGSWFGCIRKAGTDGSAGRAIGQRILGDVWERISVRTGKCKGSAHMAYGREEGTNVAERAGCICCELGADMMIEGPVRAKRFGVSRVP